MSPKRRDPRKPSVVPAPGGTRRDTDIASRIAGLTGRVFARLGRWALMAVVITGMLGLVAWLAALIALRHSSWWGVTPAVVLLIVLTIPCLAALLLRRRAGVVHRSAAGIEAEIVEALRHPQLAAGLRSFLDDDADGDDGRAGLVRLTKGAMGVRMAIREHRGSFVDLAAAVRAMLLSPANLLVITGGMVLLVIAVAVFVLAAIF